MDSMTYNLDGLITYSWSRASRGLSNVLYLEPLLRFLLKLVPQCQPPGNKKRDVVNYYEECVIWGKAYLIVDRV